MTSGQSPVPEAQSPKSIHVVAGALLDGDRVLIAQRPSRKHMAGGWEFPGGKREEGETPFDCLVRELSEEIDVIVQTAVPVIAYLHDYGDRRIFLDLWLVTRYQRTPLSAEGQPIKWVRVDELEKVGLLAADAPMIEPLRRAIEQLDRAPSY